MTPTEFFKSTIRHFGVNPNERRSKDDRSGRCLYSPPTDKPQSKGCAIGRFLKPEVREKFDGLSNSGIDMIMIHDTQKPLLPEWMQKMDVHLLKQVQAFHDTFTFWDKRGLSKEGKREANDIIHEFSLDMPLYYLEESFGG